MSALPAATAVAGASPPGAAGALVRVLARPLWSAAALSLSRDPARYGLFDFEHGHQVAVWLHEIPCTYFGSCIINR